MSTTTRRPTSGRALATAMHTEFDNSDASQYNRLEMTSAVQDFGQQRRKLDQFATRIKATVGRRNTLLEQYASGEKPDAYPSDEAASRARDMTDALEAVLVATKNAEKAVFIAERNAMTVLGYHYELEQ